jgi:DNA-binding transcriptional MocR family regulator
MVSKIGREIQLSPVELASRISRRGNVINLASGSPDPSTILHLELAKIYSQVIQEMGPSCLGYPGAGGQEQLIRELESLVKSFGIGLRGQRIVVTSGAQHAIELIAKYFLEEGVTAVENPTFVETFYSLKLRSSAVIPVELEADGISVPELERLLKVVRVDLLYVIPTCHNPAGVTMSEEKRKALVELAEEFDFHIVEDDPYRPIAGQQPNPIKALDRSGRVIYIGSFSKVLAPGLRVGYIVADEETAEKISLLEQLDFSTSTLNQYVVARALSSGLVANRMNQLHDHYRRKVNALITSLNENRLVDFREPSCGYFVLLDLGRDSMQVLEKAIEGGVVFVPASPFFIRGGETKARLSASVPSEAEIEEGVKRLAYAVRNS